ncbi:hypothetical protein [Endozoicomonas sp. 2B-B]
MDFLRDLTNFAGELKANVRRPLIELENEFRKQRMADALNNVIELDARRQQAGDLSSRQVPLRPVTFDRGDELRMAQQMKLAGIDPGAIAQDKMAAERLSLMQRAGSEIDNPYALANIANKLDASPVRHSGGITYDRFNAEKPILSMTDAVLYDGQSKRHQALMDEMRYKQLAKIWADPDTPEFVKTDALNNKSITKTDRVKVVGKDGKEQYSDAILTPSGWRYAPATDSTNQPLQVPASGEATTLSKNLQLVAKTWDLPAEEALGYLLLSKTKSQAQVRNDLYMKAANNPTMAGDMEETSRFVEDMMQAMYPEEKEGSPSPKPGSKAPPKQLIVQAAEAINKGADRQDVLDRIAKQGYSIQGVDL